ncbi:MAG: TonB-dependent receptor [Ignavibacteria bacterium]|nr:TonB-dependent receptor [Ignavibacteria bacterium]MDH7528447.1 TonB-dependent receptor [Ignavibacteria bacterium]
MKLHYMLLSLIIPLLSFAQQKYDDKYYLIPKSDTISYQLEEVVVTGTRTYQRAIDIPYSITTLTNLNYKFDKKTSINDVLGFVPGVFMQSRYGNHDVRISIRGFGSRSNSGIRGVRILLDGIPESEPDGQTRIEAIDFNAVGRIEIVKGNSSSLYTNAPGGVVNFINNVYSPINYVTQFNEIGSYGLRRNGFKVNLRSKNAGLIMTYTYHNYEGYREHSPDFWNILNTVFEVTPADNSRLEVLGYFVDGVIKLPGSLKLAEYQQDPLQAAPDEKNFDYRRYSRKGRVGLRYNKFWGENNANEIEISGYGTIKYFERIDKRYRIFNRWGVGGTSKYTNRTLFLGKKNEFTAGVDLFYQTGPIEVYSNVNGLKTDVLRGITNETISNAGFFLLDTYSLIPDKLNLLISGRYDNVTFYDIDRLAESRNSIRKFNAFTPKFGLNYKLRPDLAIYGSAGYSFDVPAGNELDNFPLSSDAGAGLLNPDLKPQFSTNFELGLKGRLRFVDLPVFSDNTFDLTLFSSVIRDEIVPFEVFGSVFYRNAAKTWRRGIEFGSDSKLMYGFRLKTSYTYSLFRYVEYTAQAITGNQNNFVIAEQNYSGNVVPSVPEHNLNLALTYEKSLTLNTDFFSKLSYQYISGMYVNDVNSEKTDPYNLLNFMIGIDQRFGKVNVLLSTGVNNIFNKRYVGFININSTSGRFYELGEPRMYFMNINIGYTL